jgi:hypothetical protein
VNKKEPKMKIETAIKQIQNEAKFLGMEFLDVIKDVEKFGRMIYSERTVEAARIVREKAQHIFA